jgi:hypothetical protein
LVDAAGCWLTATTRVPDTAPVKTRLSVNVETEEGG